MGDIYGYIRVSEKSQNPQRQWDIMTEQEGSRNTFLKDRRARQGILTGRHTTPLVGTENTVTLLSIAGDLLVYTDRTVWGN